MTDGARRTTTASLLALLAVMLGACGGKSDGGAATVPDGGACGNYPLCVAALMESCLVAGSCTIADTGDMRVITFASGVVESTIVESPERQTTRVTTTDGVTTCYTVQITAPAGGAAAMVWRNAADATVAAGIVNKVENYIDVTCAGDGTARVTELGDCFGRANVCATAP